MKNAAFIFLFSLFCIGTVGAQISASWKLTGPNKFPAMDNSDQINGIGRIQQLVFHATNPNKIYAVSASGGLYISTDAAITWAVTPGTEKLPAAKCVSVCVDYTNDNIIYLGTGDGTYHFNSLGIYKSTDGGLTFNPSNTGIGNRRAADILMSPSNNSILIAATDDGIWKSTNAGASWTVKKSGSCFDNMRFNPANPNIVYAIASSEFYRSTDMGDTWTIIPLPGSGNTVEGRIGVSPANANIVYITFVGDFNSNPKTCTPVLKSSNSGQSFTVVKPANSYNLAGYDENSTGWGWWEFTMAVDPLNANNVWVGTHAVFNSKDGGVTWNRLTYWTSVMHTDFHHIVYSPHDATKLYNVNDGGVWINTDNGHGSQWSPKSNGLGCTEIYHAAQSPIKKDRIGIGTQDNGELYYSAGNWYTVRGGDFSATFAFDYQHSDWFYHVSGGNRRTGLSGNSGSQNLSFPFAAAGSTLMEFTPLKTNSAFLAANDIWRTDNLASNPPAWTKISTISEAIKALNSSPADANIVYAVTNSGKVFRSDNALSASASFAQVSTAPSSVSSKASIAAIKADPNIVYMSCNSKVYRSADKGATWTSVSAGLPAVNFIKMYHDVYSTDESLYVATGTGAVYFKNKNMSSWLNYSQGLPSISNVNDFMIFNDGNYANSVLRVAYYGRGVWESPLVNPAVNVKETENNEFQLLAFPNPTTGSFEISLNNTAKKECTLVLTDVLGRVLLQEKILTDAYKKAIQVKEKGMYLITVITENNRLVKKVMVE